MFSLKCLSVLMLCCYIQDTSAISENTLVLIEIPNDGMHTPVSPWAPSPPHPAPQWDGEENQKKVKYLAWDKNS